MKVFAKSCVVFSVCMLILCTVAQAGTITSYQTGNWNSGFTWWGGVAPTASDVVVIASGHIVSTAGSRACAGITISGTLSMASGDILTVAGNVSGMGAWVMAGPGSSPRTISLTGNWSFNGTSSGNTAAITFTGANAQTFSGKLSTGNGSLTINKTGGSVTLGSAIDVGGTFTMTAGTFDASTYLLSAAAEVFTSGTLRAGASTWTANYTLSSMPTLPAGFTIEYYNTAPTIDASFVYQNLVFSGAGTAVPDAGIEIQGNLLNTGGGTLNFGSNAVTLSGTVAANSIAGFTTTGLVSMTKTAGTATFTGNVNAGALTISGSGGTLDLGAGLTHTFTGIVTLTAGTLNGGSSTLNENAVSSSAWKGTATLFTPGTGTVNFGAAGNQTLSASGTKTFYNLTFSGSGTKTDASTTVNNVFSIEGTAVASAAPTYGSGATLKYNTSTARAASVEWITPFIASGGVIIANTGTISLNAAKVLNAPLTINAGATLNTTSANNYSLEFGDDFVNNGTLTANASPITISGTATQSIAGFTTTGLLSMTKTGGTATLTGNVSGAAFTLSGVGGTLNLGSGLTHSFSGIVTRTNGTLDLNSSTLNLSGSTSGSGGTWTPSTSTVNFTSGSAQTVPGWSFYDLGFSGAGTKTIATGTTVTVGRNWAVGSAVTMTTTANATVTGDISGNGAITMGSGTITLGGNWSNNGTFTRGTGRVVYNGAATQSIASINYYHLTTSGLGVKNAAGALTISGNYTNTSTVNMAGYTLTVSGTTSNTDGCLRFSGATNGRAIGTGIIEYTGSGQTIASGTYDTLLINQSSGNATLGGAVTVDGALVFSAGRLVTTDSYVLSLGSSAQVAGAGASSYVFGSLLKLMPTGAQSFTFTIGDASTYAPVAVSFANITIGGNLTAKTMADDYANIASSGVDETRDVNRYWTLTGGGLGFTTYSATFMFAAGDVSAGANTASFVVRNYDAAWAAVATGTKTSTSTQATGLTTFGDFLVGNQQIDHYTVAASTPQTAGTTFAATVTAKDILEQTVSDNNSTVVTMTNSGSGQFDSNGNAVFGDNTKTLSGGTFSIQTRDTVAETISLSAIDPNYKTGTLNDVVVHPGAASVVRSTVGASPESITADGATTSAITIQLKDAYGNNLTASGGTVVLTTTAGTLSSVTDHANGTYSATLTSATTVRSAVISGTLNGSALASTATVVFTVGPASAAQSTISVSPDSIVANGSSTSTVSVHLKDAFGNDLTYSEGTLVVNTTNGTLGSITDHNNGIYTAVLTSPTSVGGATISGTLNGSAMTSTASVAFIPGAASLAQSTIVASPTSITANGTSTSTITTRLKDAFGNNLVASGGTVALGTTAGSLGSVTDNHNGTYTATLTSPTIAGSATISGTLNGAAFTSTASVTLTAGPATQIAVSAGDGQSATAGSAVATAPSVIVKDVNNNVVSGVSVTFVVASGGGSGTGLTATTNASGIATVGSWTLGAMAGSNTMTATSGSLTGSPVIFTATGTAGAATQISVNAGNGQSSTAGSAVATAPSVIVKDVNNNVVSGVSVTFAVATGGGAVTGASATTNASGIATVGSWTLGTIAGSNTMTATSGTLTGSPVTFTSTGTAGMASLAQSAITASPVSIEANGTTTSTITVQAKDAYGNNLTSSAGIVTLQTTAGTLGSVTDHTNGSYSAVLTSPTLAGTAAITGTLGGSALSGQASVSFIPGEASPVTSTITASPVSITANGTSTSTITVQLKDDFGNNINASGGTVVLFTTAGTLSTVTDHADGTYTATLTSPTVTGSATITGSLQGVTGANHATVTFTAGAPSLAQSTITASPTSMTANGASTSTITVQLKDANGNNLTASGGTIALGTTAGSLGSVTDNSNGTYTATLTSPTLAGSATISGTLNGSAITATATVTFTAGAASLAQSTITASPTSITANGTSTSTITVQLKDANGNNLTASGGTVALGTTAGTLGSVTDNSNGMYSAMLTSPTVAGSATISGTLNGSAVTATATVTFTAGAPSLAQSTITASPTSITANGTSTSTITVQLKDANGNNLTASGGTVALGTTAGTLGGVTDHANGTYSAVLTSPIVAGSATISGTLNGSAITATATVSFTAGSASLAQSTITASPTSIIANGASTSTITVQLKDANGNNLTASSGIVALGTTAGTLGSVTDNSNGTYSAVLTSSTALGTATISGTLNGGAFASTTDIHFIVGAASAAQSTISASPISIPADGTSTSTITAALKDASGHSLTASGGVVTLAASSGTLGSVTDHNNGTYTAVLTSPASSGTATITGVINDSAITATASVTFTPTAILIAGNTGVAGAAVGWTDGSSKTATADSTGAYQISVSYQWTGTVTPSKAGFTFTPASMHYTNVLTDQSNQNYTATAITYTISGNAGVAGASVSWGDGVVRTETADSLGDYSLVVSYNWSGTVTPSKTGYTFTPAAFNYVNVLAHHPAQNFTAERIVITLSGNAGVGGAVLAWTDTTAKSVTADSIGAYVIPVSYGWSGSVTPSKTGYTFAPDHHSYANVVANEASQNFTAGGIVFMITGNAGAAGVTLSWTDSTAKSITADSTGAYAIPVSYEWSGTVTPSKTGFTFTPADTSYSHILANQPMKNFTATPFVVVNLKVFLAGPYSAGSMSTALNTLGLIPLTSQTAYAAATYGYTAKVVPAIPAPTIVDWVLVELRTGTAAATKTAIQAAFLKSNGTIVDTNGTSPLTYHGIPSGQYYIVVRHRNHLPVMTAALLALNASGDQYDFTTAQEKAYGTNAMFALTGGGFGLIAGDVTGNKNVKYAGAANDRSALLLAVGAADPTVPLNGYVNSDVNLDGKAKFTGSNNDNTVILRSVGMADPTVTVTSQVPN